MKMTHLLEYDIRLYMTRLSKLLFESLREDFEVKDVPKVESPSN